jgi:hypothetical protein
MISLISAWVAFSACAKQSNEGGTFMPVAPGTAPRPDAGSNKPPMSTPDPIDKTPAAPPPPPPDGGVLDAATVSGTDAAMNPAPVDAGAADKPATPVPVKGPNERWRPTVGMTWDWQLLTPIDPSYEVQVYDVDAFENDAAVIADLHARGKKVICYINMGAWEDWRPDKDQFPADVIGMPWPDFPHERWLDIRRWDAIGPIMRARLDMARAKGCDAIEPDNLDGWNLAAHQPTGFPLTAYDQVLYNRLIASEVKRRGMSVGLKNDTLQTEDLVDDFDFHVSEQCFEFNECDHLKIFIQKGKPVFLAEYRLTLDQFCARAKEMGFSAIRKRDAVLDRWRETCPP